MTCVCAEAGKNTNNVAGTRELSVENSKTLNEVNEEITVVDKSSNLLVLHLFLLSYALFAFVLLHHKQNDHFFSQCVREKRIA